jgi:hypothetical protein
MPQVASDQSRVVCQGDAGNQKIRSTKPSRLHVSPQAIKFASCWRVDVDYREPIQICL